MVTSWQESKMRGYLFFTSHNFQVYRQSLLTQLVVKINSNTFRGGVRNVQSRPLGVVCALVVAAVLPVVVMMTVVEGGGVVDSHGLASFSTLQVKLQYAVKHQPAPSVLLYIKDPELKEIKIYRKMSNIKLLVKSECNFCSLNDERKP